MDENILIIDKLKVKYGNNCVLNINKKIVANKDDVIGIIGENGAGKSTLINSILEEVSYEGNIYRNFSLDEVGVQFQENNYNSYMLVGELISLVTRKSLKENRLQDLLKKFELESMLKKKIGILSGGEKQRLTLFLVLYLQPKVVFFDELTTGLDYKKREQILEILRNYSKGKTIFIVTHYFEELNNFANKILILDKGNCVYFGSIENLEKLLRYHRVIKVKKGRMHNFDFFTKKLKDDDEYTYLYSIDKKQHAEVIGKLDEKAIEYEILPRNLYSLYLLALIKWKEGECID